MKKFYFAGLFVFTCCKDIMLAINDLCDVVRQTSYDIHLYHGHGHFEKIYENALVHRLRSQGINVEQQHPLNVYDQDGGTLLGEYRADVLVDNRLIIEVKATKQVLDEHVAQILCYLKSAHIEHGLLINFGSYKFQVKKYIRTEGYHAGFSKLINLLAFSLNSLLLFR
jgi:GxxExxY protein